ncbi:MAG: MotA/TolQ/ExbB proton channel family protein [Gammaproteobacteria bacterium]|nr:MotA/TolQ/ExbB proton channel family protein [Gammaproteobacteria bacterium]
MKKLIIIAAAVTTAVLGFSVPDVQAATAIDVDQLLQQVRSGRARDAQINEQRLAKFRAERATQAAKVAEAKAEQQREEQRSKDLDALFEANDNEIIELEQAVQDRLGDLKELFGVIQQVAGDSRANFNSSMTQAQFPERSQFMTELAQKVGQTNRLASMEDIETLWYEIYREMVETGKVTKFNSTIINTDGTDRNAEVTRVGVFNAVADGQFLYYNADANKLQLLARQPKARFLSRAEDLENATSGLTAFPLDPSRGALMADLVKSPTLKEKFHEGGIVGYIIVGVGIVGVLLALWRLIVLVGVSGAVNRQIKNIDNPGNNPLGHVLKVYQDNPTADVETMELKLSEAIVKETPKLNKLVPILKIIAVVAPLMGLLGTVTGMIQTFQQITLHGTGDPKLMAGGISQALVTTVLGLTVAIPMVFLHTIVASRAKRVSQVLNEQASGMVAERAEQAHANQ